MAASLVEAAVRAAVLAGAPRRTVAAAAAAVASAMVAGRGCDGARAGASEPSAVSERRKKKNRRKKERRKEAAHEAAPVEEGTRAGSGVGEHPDLLAVSLATVAPPPPPEPPSGPDVTMEEEGEPSLMAAPMALSPANLEVHELQQSGQSSEQLQHSGHRPREIDFDDQSQTQSMNSQAVCALLGIPRPSMDSSAGTPVPGNDVL